MKFAFLICILLIGLIISCQSPSSKSSKANKNADTLINMRKQIDTGYSTYSQDDSNGNGCTRGQAEPIINKVVFPKTSFQLQNDSITGIEIVELDTDNKLIIKNWGCEYYCLTFRFESNRFQKDTTDLRYWFEKTIILMDEVKKGIDAPLDIKKGIEILKKYYRASESRNYQNLKLNYEIDCNEDEIKEFITIDRVEKMSETKYAVEITFSLGPL